MTCETIQAALTDGWETADNQLCAEVIPVCNLLCCIFFDQTGCALSSLKSTRELGLLLRVRRFVLSGFLTIENSRMTSVKVFRDNGL